MTRYGFYSIVEKPDDRDQGTLTVRARVRADLEALREQVLPELGEIVEHAGTDYQFRARAPRTAAAAAVATLVQALDYSNFKNEVAHRQGKARAIAYGKVWDVLCSLQSTAPAKPAARSLKVAWGGAVVDTQDRVLLRRPKGHFDGYVWTFPKGRPDPGETPEATALREVREETGWDAEIVRPIDADFAGGATVSRFFLMRPLANHGDFDRAETSEVRWATLNDAVALIRETTNVNGRARDLEILAAVERIVSP
jgi:8-oxo-dGTP pyrophosphatase MutT (NUDIX family)